MTNQEIQNITLESLRDWFKKEKWVRITTSGDIAGPCGTSKNKKNPDRCLPRAKAQSLTKAQRAATARKKKKAGAKGKTVVKNTKAAKVTRENNDRSWSRSDMDTYIDETLGGYLERYLGYNPGPPGHPMYKMSHEQFAAYIAQEFMDGIDELLDEVDTSIEFIRDAIEDAYEQRKKIAMGIGHDPDMHFEPEEEKIGADALEMVLQTLDKMATPTKLESMKAAKVKKEGYYGNTQLEDEIRQYGYDSFEQFFADNPGAEEAVFDFIDQNLARMQKETANPQDGKAAPHGSGYKKVTKEDIANLVVGTIHEIQNKGTIEEKDDRCTRIAKRKYDTWPSAYASGAVVRCRRGEIWKGVSEDLQESDCKHGRYFCNHDKRYKCRKGPKKSR